MKISSTEQLGHAVRKLRKEAGVKQSTLAMTAGTGVRFIVDLEKGKPTCQLGKVLHVLAMLGASVNIDTGDDDA